MHHHQHHTIAHLLHLLAGAGLGMAAASLAMSIGGRSADRMPGESRWPHCLFCMKALTWQAITPLFGWLLRPDTLQFPCACGLRKNQTLQPLAEMLGLLLGVLGMYVQDWSLAALPLCIGLGLLPSIALIDIGFGIIPDGLNLILGVCGLGWQLVLGTDLFMAAIVAAAMLGLGLFYALVYSKWRGKEMLGLGDVKFMTAAGLWLSPPMAATFMVIAGVAGVAIGLLWRYTGGGREFPFAPALCLSLAITVLAEISMAFTSGLLQ